MKLKKGHLFLILLLSLFLYSSLASFGVVEGMDNIDKPDNKDNKSNDMKDPKDPKDILPIRTNSSSVHSQNSMNGMYPQTSINGNDYEQNEYSNLKELNGLIKSVSLDDGRVIYSTPQNTINGIPGKNIPPGHEDLYILKSQVVPPVCPACPTTIINTTDSKKECPACPPCGRCPESSFECVKRPTYRADNPYLPVPVLSDFSAFGM